MKICWDNLEKISLCNGHKGFKRIMKSGRTNYYYARECCYCSEEVLVKARKRFKDFVYCSVPCARKHQIKRGLTNWKEHTDEERILLSREVSNRMKSFWGSISLEEKNVINKKRSVSNKKFYASLSEEEKKQMNSSVFTDEVRNKISKGRKGKALGSAHGSWHGGGVKENKAPFTTYSGLATFEEIRRDPDNYDFLQVMCTYCGRWFTPKRTDVVNRVNYINGKKLNGEGRFYCSTGCKKACPIFKQVLFPKGFKPATSREVQPELRQMVLERDNWTCQFEDCYLTIEETELHCHHIIPVAIDGIISADVDNCITLCKEHHKFIHSKKGCGYNDLKGCQ